MPWYGYGWRPYVPVARRRANARKEMQSLRKKGVDIQPVEIEGRKIAKTFWGAAWCDHLESFSDYENRLPRGRTYVRNGSVCHLEIGKGQVLGKVAGSELYNIQIQIKALSKKKWNSIKQRCAGQVGSLLELLQGKLSSHVMEVVTDRKDGLFPRPQEISLKCDCPDWADLCKHLAAVLYGVGARLDQQPELLFRLRGVDHEELIEADAEAAVSTATSRGASKRLAAAKLSDVFGIDLETSSEAAETSRPRKKQTRRAKAEPPRKTVVKKRPVKKKVAKKSAKRSVKTSAKKKTAEKPAKKTVRKPAAKQPAAKAAAQSTGASTRRKKSAKKVVLKKRTSRARAAAKHSY